MDELLSIIVRPTPGTVAFDNYEQVKAALIEQIDVYNKLDYSDHSLESIRSDRDLLKRVKKQVSDAKKMLLETYDAPVVDVKAKLDELIAIVDEPLKMLDGMVKEAEKKALREEIMSYARSRAAVLGVYGDKVLDSKSFFNERWMLSSCTKKKWKEDIDNIIATAQSDINSINEIGGEQQNLMLARYYETLSMDGMGEFVKNATTDISADIGDSEDNEVLGYKVIKVYGTERQMVQLFMDMDILSIDYEEIEDGMPQEMNELTVPAFDSFVAFDIEHTGTYGSSRGDAPAEIIEIGAVKVVDGVIVETFDELANPGRKIVPLVSRLTHITDDMVQDKPSVDEVISKFREFVGNAILVGHNITGCDLPHICRAAKHAGFAFENAFLDTKKLAMKHKDAFGWDNVKLTTLSEYYGIEQNEAHRAWCDAEANAYVYLKLKEV